MLKRIPILMYHSVEPDGSERIDESEKFYNITPYSFREQIRYLKENGYRPVTLAGLLQSEHDAELPCKPIMLTFDDGYISHYDTVLPILKEYGFSGAFFLVSSDIAKEYRINWEQAIALKKSGMDIGSHGVNHEIIDKFPYPNLIIELKASKLELEENLGMNITAFSIPRGFYSTKISNVARGMGYKLVFTSFTGNISLYSNPYCLRRIVMLGNYTMKEFISIVQKNPIFLIRKHGVQLAKDLVQKTIGMRGYEWIKKVVFSKA